MHFVTALLKVSSLLLGLHLSQAVGTGGDNSSTVTILKLRAVGDATNLDVPGALQLVR